MTIAMQGVTNAIQFPIFAKEKEPKHPDGVKPAASEHSDSSVVDGLHKITALIEEHVDTEKKAGVTFDMVTEAFKDPIKDANDKLTKLRDELASAQSVVDDLSGLRAVLTNYIAGGAWKGGVDLSTLKVTLSKDSPLRQQAEYKDGAADAKQVLAYYSKEHPELNLPTNPTSLAQLKSLDSVLSNSIKAGLEFRTQRTNVELQDAIQHRNTLVELQGMIYRAISDVIKKFSHGS
ncbi:MAG: hypothetical protein JWP38_1110 [Herbaspirillum sp.]|nr:hypothetical protein [Herbaspirillum sp.]